MPTSVIGFVSGLPSISIDPPLHRFEAGDQQHSRALATARRPNQAHEFAGLDVQIDRSQGMECAFSAPIGLAEIAGNDRGADAHADLPRARNQHP